MSRQDPSKPPFASIVAEAEARKDERKKLPERGHYPDCVCSRCRRLRDENAGRVLDAVAELSEKAHDCSAVRDLAALRSQLAAATARVEAAERERDEARAAVARMDADRQLAEETTKGALDEQARCEQRTWAAEAERDRLRADLERERADFAHVNLAVEAAEAARDAALALLRELVGPDSCHCTPPCAYERARALLASPPTPGPATGRTITVRHYDLLGELNVEQVMGIPRDENLWAEIRVSRGHETGTLDVISEIRPESYREPTPGPAEPTESPSEPGCKGTTEIRSYERSSVAPAPDVRPCPGCPDCHPSEPVKP